MAALAAVCGIVDAAGALAAGGTGFSNGVGFVFASAETSDGPESLRAGADSAPFKFLRFISLESPNVCSFNPISPDAVCDAGVDFSVFSSVRSADFATTAVFTVFTIGAALFLAAAAELIFMAFALVELSKACFAAEVFCDAATRLEANSFLAAVTFFDVGAFFSAESLREAFALLAATGLAGEDRLRADFDFERFGRALSGAVDTFFVTFLRAAIGQVSRNARQNHPSTARVGY